jgi:SAM-dependent methyltransferase
MVNKNKFYNFLFDYKPLVWEEFNEKDPRFELKKKYANYALKNRYRFYITLKYALRHFPSEALKILDIGTYPGTWLRILKGYLSDYKVELYGAGLYISPEFIKAMNDKVDAKIMVVNLDPNNEQLKGKNYPSQIPLEDESIDFIFALEIIEHLTSPRDMLSQARRVLKKGGKILITTPNVTRIGSALKLLTGKSNLDRLMPLDYCDPGDEWRPHFHEYSLGELTDQLSKVNFKVADKAFFNSTERYFDIKTMKRRLIDLFKLTFYCLPHLRDGILIVAEKK